MPRIGRDGGDGLPGFPAIPRRVGLPSGGKTMTYADIYWFFRRKLRILLLAFFTYAALC